MKKSTIPCTLDIWDAAYEIEDNGNKMIVQIPCRKYENSSSWVLSSAEEKIDDHEIMRMIRKMVNNQNDILYAKDSMTSFSFIQVLYGIPSSYGWMADDFE